MFYRKKFLSKILFLLQPFLLTACFYSMNGCNSGEVKKSVLPGLDADYLVLNEKILLNFYGSPDEKDWAIKTLERRCLEEEDPHACYNLSSHLFSQKSFDKSKKFAEKAIFLNPNDSLYFEMYRQSLIESGKLDTNKKKDSSPNLEISNLYTKLELDCRKKETERAFQTTKEMIEQGLLSSETIQNGFIKECLSDSMVLELSRKAKKNKINYSSHYFAEKNKSNLFYSIWDTSYLTQKKPIEKEEELKYKLTQYWRDFRKAILAKNDKLAKKNFGEFIQQLKEEKTNSKTNLNLFLAIERAAKILIEQDEFFAKYKNLAQEF